MNYKVLGSTPVNISLGNGFIVADSHADRYSGCVGILILQATSTIILKFKNGTREAFRRTSLMPTGEGVSDGPPQRYRQALWVETKCGGCGVVLKHEKSGFKEGFDYHCKGCRKAGAGRVRPHPISDNQMLELYFDGMQSCVDIADYVGGQIGLRPSPSTIARWLKKAITTDGQNRRLRTQGESSILARRRAEIRRGRGKKSGDER